jgi:4-amino-4-deoxy-L-arabinose transferase-like glycosyltransferase
MNLVGSAGTQTSSLLSDWTLHALAAAKLLLHLALNLVGGYGFFRDEFYYIACSEHLDWGYVDHPPLSIGLLWLNRLFFGDSLFALRLLPAVAGVLLVYMTAMIVRELGGGKGARLLACVAVIVAPIFLSLSTIYSMNAFELLFWASATYVVIRIVNARDQKLWLLFGLLAGLGLQNKHSMAILVVCLIAGFALTGQRKRLSGPWFWWGATLVFVLILPNLIWQIANGLPTLEFLRNAQEWKNTPLSPLEFLSSQVLLLHPLAMPLWAAGLVAFMMHKRLKRYRMLGFALLIMSALFILQKGKAYYLSPIFPVFFAGGAVLLEEMVANRKWARAPVWYARLLAVGGALTLPLAIPILPVDTYIGYASLLGISEVKTERHDQGKLPQFYADMFGWQELADDVARVYQMLSEEDRARVAIYAQNYGEAGAIDFFGKKHGLPKAISGHNNYWLWGPRSWTGQVMIIVGGRAEDHERVFQSVQHVATHSHPYAMPYENDLPIFICRSLKVSLREMWPAAKSFI